ncbi:hypothetical protein BHE74_00020078 [Ensete ventricosum]|nr:hypothetical protein GW17_00043873 [Ensete ventricosum]RWW72132.1 hypothetical protein BHE74_00020078 [Ensete ventricosum]RZS20899.1 hypothetical protein BHM03_00053473 [Ensete ventricosum]
MAIQEGLLLALLHKRESCMCFVALLEGREWLNWTLFIAPRGTDAVVERSRRRNGPRYDLILALHLDYMILDRIVEKVNPNLDPSTITFADTSLIIDNTSHIGNCFSASTAMHATMMFNNTVSFSLDALFPDNPRSSLESFHSYYKEQTHQGDVTTMFLHQVLEGGLPDEELVKEDTKAVDVQEGGEVGLEKVGLGHKVEEGGGCNGRGGGEVMG